MKVAKIEGIENFTELFPGLSVMHASWFDALKAEMEKDSFRSLSKFVKEQRSKGTVYPTPENVFSWTKRPLYEIKVTVYSYSFFQLFHG